MGSGGGGTDGVVVAVVVLDEAMLKGMNGMDETEGWTGVEWQSQKFCHEERVILVS